jgi:hypothetical protein
MAWKVLFDDDFAEWLFADRHGFWGGGDRYPASEAEISRFCNQSSW